MSTDYSPSYLQRFGGMIHLYGYSALSLFSRANICVIGIGGVGSWVAEALARTGIGNITLIDMDEVCITNTNRQIHALHQNIGKLKTDVMAQRILAINPECHVICVDDFITSDNIIKLLDRGFSYVIDAIDNARIKAALLSYCYRHKIPVVTTGATGGKIDPTKIEVIDLAKTIQDPLAAKLRECLKHDFCLLKHHNGILGIDCVSSKEPLIPPRVDRSRSMFPGEIDRPQKVNCSTGLGAATMVTATFGFVAVSHVLKKMLAKFLC